MAQAIAFLIMPFDRKRTGQRRRGAPAEIDFDALWERVYKPMLSELGYVPIRADGDVGALILTEMLQRVALADLVVADLTLPNANVYYEVGVRHAAKKVGCVLVAAEWARPVFDLAQMRQVRYPLPEGAITEPTATAARGVLAAQLSRFAVGSSPVFQALPGYPTEADPGRVTMFTDFVNELSDFDAEVRKVHHAPQSDRRRLALDARERYGRSAVVVEAVVLALIRLLRDYVGWGELLDYIATLPDHVAGHPLVKEQRCLAVAKGGDPLTAAGLLEQLIAEEGETSERRGLLGGRYKTLWRRAVDEADQRRYLDDAIEQYEMGMRADLNDYYPSSNLARLYRARAHPGDEEKATSAATVAMVASGRALQRDPDDEWARPTLLGMAFDAGTTIEVARLADAVSRDGPALWKLNTTIEDLRGSVRLQRDATVVAELAAALARLEALLPAAGLPAGGSGGG